MCVHIYIYIHTHHIFVHSSVSGHLGCYRVLAIVNRIAMHIGVHGSFWIIVLSGYMPRDEISESYGHSIFNFLRNLQNNEIEILSRYNLNYENDLQMNESVYTANFKLSIRSHRLWEHKRTGRKILLVFFLLSSLSVSGGQEAIQIYFWIYVNYTINLSTLK